MKERPFSIQLTIIMVLINATIWLVFGLIVGLGLHPTLPDKTFYQWAMSIIPILAGIFLLLMAYYLRQSQHLAWYFSLLFFVAAAVATIFDDFGWIDLVFVIISLVPAFLLLKDRKWYLS